MADFWASDPVSEGDFWHADPVKNAAPENSLAGSAKAIGSGLANAGIGLAGMSGDARGLASGLANFAIPGAGPAVDKMLKYAVPGMGGPSSQDVRGMIESQTGSLDYKPQTKLEGYLKTAGEFLPAAVTPGSAVRKAAMVAAPALASEAAGQATQGQPIEPYARLAGGIAGGVGASVAGRAALEAVGGLGTHTGADSIKTAYNAGLKGGEAGQSFREHLRGNAPMDEVIADAKSALSNLRQQKNIEYQSGMAGIHGDATVLDFSAIDKAAQRMNAVKSFKGVELSPATKEVRQEIGKIIDEWKGYDPKDFHTPGGFDALKQTIGEIKDSLPFNTPQRTVAEQIYNAVRGTIVKQAPKYADVMKGYETASNQISEIEKTLSLGKKASNDTALRKLQSVMRNNVNTNYGKRAELAQKLADNGAPNLMEKLSGQANATWMPRGLGKAVAPIVAGSSYFNPMAAAALPLMSPRLMAEAAHGLGRVSAGARNIGNQMRGVVGFPAIPETAGNALPLQSVLALQQLMGQRGP